MIESKIINEVKQNTPEFPKLMTCSYEKDGCGMHLVVLMLANRVGIVVYSNKPDYYNHKVGEYCTNWSMENFKDFSGEISLKNS